MNHETLAALKASIQHWRDNVAAESPDDVRLGTSSCALCRLFRPGCVGCPVAGKTGLSGCNGTSYEDAFYARNRWSEGKITRTTWQKYARRDLKFLISLLPEGEQP